MLRKSEHLINFDSWIRLLTPFYCITEYALHLGRNVGHSAQVRIGFPRDHTGDLAVLLKACIRMCRRHLGLHGRNQVRSFFYACYRRRVHPFDSHGGAFGVRIDLWRFCGEL